MAFGKRLRAAIVLATYIAALTRLIVAGALCIFMGSSCCWIRLPGLPGRRVRVCSLEETDVWECCCHLTFAKHARHARVIGGVPYQPAIKRIHAALVQRGYTVWIDVEQMMGSTVDAMSAAVENASVVLVGVSLARGGAAVWTENDSNDSSYRVNL